MVERSTSFFERALAGIEQTEFNLFEPFDVPARPQWLMDLAKTDEVEISPHGNEFQTGILLDTQETPGMAMAIAGQQSGKSRAGMMEAIIMASGQIPISLRYDKGVDTGVARLVTKENIARFGQREDGSCGNIIGVGKYPQEKIPPLGSQIWICTYKEAKEKMWRPKIRNLMPPYLLDQSKGTGGFSEMKQTFFLANGNSISFITYEQDYHRVQAEKAWLIDLDEEPPDRKFWTAAMEHCTYLRMYYSPINGLSWTWTDLYMPVMSGHNKYCKVYYCSQYDSPYHKREKVEQKIKTYKPWEVKALVWGQFSDMAGKPYYTFDITQKNLRLYIPRHSYATIMPSQKPETVRDALKIKMIYEQQDGRGEDRWEVYEEYSENNTYWMSADVGEGNENPDAASDASVAYVRRLPKDGEKAPKMVATLYSKMRNVEFAWMCLYGAIYYNYCLIAPEARGEDAAVFLTTIMGYPFIYKHVVTSDKTRRLKEMDGFDTTVGNRKLIFDLCGTWIYDRVENSEIYHYELLKEYAECIVGKNGRPDHGEHGHTDCLMAFGIGQYVYQFALNQIRNNRGKKNALAREPGPSMFPNIFPQGRFASETRKVLGTSRGLDQRARYEERFRRLKAV